MILFDPGVFQAELVADPRVRRTLLAALGGTGETIGASDLLAGVVRGSDAQVMETLARALRPGYAMEDLLAAADGHRAAADGDGKPERRRESFAPEALAALEEFQEVVGAGGDRLRGVALELLLGCVLKRLGPRERNTWRMLDTDRALELLREQVGRALGSQAGRNREPNDAGDGVEGVSFSPSEPFRLPGKLAPSEDLTFQAQAAAADGYPFDDDPQYERLFGQIARALCRRGAHHVLLGGERGVGKVTVLAELARRGACGRVPFLRHKRFVLADCRYTAPEESRQRLLALLSHVAPYSQLILCIEGFGALLRTDRAGSNRGLLLSALSRVRCRIIGLVSPHDCEELVSDDPDMAEFFTPVEVHEPDAETAVKLLGHFALGLAEKLRVTIDPEAVRRAVVLASGYILNERLPAVALKVLHRVCEEIDYQRTQLGASRDRVTEEDVIEAVAETSGVPQETLRGVAEKSDYRRSLSEVILGQEHAVGEVATELGLIKAGLTDPNKPASVMLFVGQTGTGKTEMGKALARFYSTTKRLRTYTLGNFVEPHSVAGIIGVPPGYVGHDQGGRLVNDLCADPYCVFLLDEADKAHPDVLQPFLNLFDEGWVRDQRGVQAWADKSIFILTTNVGQRMIADLAAKGESMEEITRRMKEALSQIRHSKSNRPVFTPEFLARIKRIIVFRPLDKEAMHGIARKLVAEMQDTWREKRGKRLEVPEELIQHIAERSHEINEQSKGKEGGRIVRKLIAELIEAAVQRETSERPGEYRACKAVVLKFVPPPEEAAGGQPKIEVGFAAEDSAGDTATPDAVRAPAGEPVDGEARRPAEAATDVGGNGSSEE